MPDARLKKVLYLLWVPAFTTALLIVIFAISGKRTNVEVSILSPNTLQATEDVWNHRNFIAISNSAAVNDALIGMMSKLKMRADAKNLALASIQGILAAYAASDWPSFERFRIPLPDFNVPPDVEVALRKHGPEAYRNRPIVEVYQAIWEATFKEPLFFSVSFVTNSLTLLDMPFDRVKFINLPEFTDPTNENWLEATPTLVFDYSAHLKREQEKTNANQSPMVLRLFFFGHDESGHTKPYMIVFVWDEENAIWLPSQFTHLSAKTPGHDIRFF